MKAVWYEETGKASDVLKTGSMDNPRPLKGEVLVEMKSSGINPSDVKIRAGARGELQYPIIIPHSDGGGIIREVGEGVDVSRIGERVWVWNGAFERAFGTCAELISIPETQSVRLNENTSFEEAACLGIPASTAYYGIFADGNVKDKTILVSGGAGAVGSYGIQLAKWGGAKVISTVSNDLKAEEAEKNGADLVLNYKEDDIINTVRDHTNGQGVDRILEVEFGGNLHINEKIIKKNGVIASYGSAAIMEPKLPFYDLMFKGVKIDTYLIYIVKKNIRKNIIEGLNKAMAEDALRHRIAQTYTLEEVVKAHQDVESGAMIGNVVVKI